MDNIINSRVAIGLCANSASRYQGAIMSKGLSTFIKLTPYTNYGDNSRILATTKRGQFHMFKHFECFNIEVYYFIILSVVFISCAISGHKKSIKLVLETFWTYLSPLYFMAHLILIWELVWLFHILGYSAVQYYWQHFRVNSWNSWLKPDPSIGSTLGMTCSSGSTWEYKLSHRQIWVYFITKNPNNSVAQDLYLRTDLFPFTILSDPLLKMFDYKGVSEGKVAIAFPSPYLHVFKRYLMKLDMSEDIDFHISEFGDTMETFFLMV